MKTLKEKIAVMQAAEEGKQIQSTIMGSEWTDVCESCLDWNWAEYDYRVKPEPKAKKLRPYTFEEAKTVEGEKVISKDGTAYGTIIGAANFCGKVLISAGGFNFYADRFLKEYTFLDGSPCGVMEGGEDE